MTSAAAPKPHWHAVDFIKAIAILAVVAAHSGVARWGSAGRYDLDFFLTRIWTPFHVPAFLIVSGFLYASVVPIDGRTIGRRLNRILVPYVIASVTVFLTLGTAPSFLAALILLAAASALSIYYYVFLMVCLILLLWPLSRIPIWSIGVLLVLCFLGELARLAWPATLASKSPTLSMRNIFDHFVLGYFLVGWLVALSMNPVRRIVERHAKALTLAAFVGLVFFGAVYADLLPGPPQLARIGYTISVVGAVALLTRTRTSSRVILFLSESSLAIYLFHRIFQQLALPWLMPLPDVFRLFGQFAVGLGGSILLVLLVRRIAGPDRARRLIGG